MFRSLTARTILRQALTASEPWTPREAPCALSLLYPFLHHHIHFFIPFCNSSLINYVPFPSFTSTVSLFIFFPTISSHSYITLMLLPFTFINCLVRTTKPFPNHSFHRVLYIPSICYPIYRPSSPHSHTFTRLLFFSLLLLLLFSSLRLTACLFPVIFSWIRRKGRKRSRRWWWWRGRKHNKEYVRMFGLRR